MSEKEAWEYLAEKWSRAKVKKPTVSICESSESDCLCHSILDLRFVNKLTQSKYERMRRCARRAAGEVYTYAWTQDAKGAKQRAAFCRQMAKECK